jgi:hypothetical protein
MRQNKNKCSPSLCLLERPKGAGRKVLCGAWRCSATGSPPPRRAHFARDRGRLGCALICKFRVGTNSSAEASSRSGVHGISRARDRDRRLRRQLIQNNSHNLRKFSEFSPMMKSVSGAHQRKK